MSKQEQQHVGAAVVAWGSAVELLETIYRDQEGEVDAQTEAIEATIARLGDDALESLCRFHRFLDDGLAALARESERINTASGRINRRKAWVARVALSILESAGKKSKAVGPFRAKSKIGSERLIIGEDFSIDDAPESVVRIVPATEESRVLDKTAAKKLLKSSDELPIPGLRIERGPTTFSVD